MPGRGGRDGRVGGAPDRRTSGSGCVGAGDKPAAETATDAGAAEQRCARLELRAGAHVVLGAERAVATRVGYCERDVGPVHGIGDDHGDAFVG